MNNIDRQMEIKITQIWSSLSEDIKLEYGEEYKKNCELLVKNWKNR